MKYFAPKLKQILWTVPFCLTVFSPIAAQALTVKSVTSSQPLNSSFATEIAAIVSENVSEDTEKKSNPINSDLPTANMNTGVASNTTSLESQSKIYKSSGEALLALLVLLGVPTVVIFLVANSNGSYSSRRSSRRRSSSSSYTGGGYTGGNYGGGSDSGGGGYSGGGDSGGGSFGGGDSGGGGAGGDF